MIDRRDLRIAAILAGLPLVFVAALWLTGRTVFWGDLTYIHHPWRALSAEFLQRGMLPLWNPYVYLGMPLAAEMQCAAWYPGTVPFYLFSFVGALRLYHWFHYGLAGVFTFFWLRQLRLARAAALCGALLFMGGGILVSRVPFLNHLSTLAFLPAFLLFSSSVWLLGLSLAIGFLSGYPAMLAGGAAIAFFTPRLVGSSSRRAGPGVLAGVWSRAALIAVVLSACLLLPAIELASNTRRGSMGLGLDDTLGFGYSLSDLRQWIGPAILSPGEFSPAISWWKTCYVGVAGSLLVVLGFLVAGRRASIGLAALLGAVTILILGGENPLSLWLWTRLPPLHYVRYPGNMSYLAAPALSLLAAVAVHRRRWAWIAALAVAFELAGYVVVSHPTVPGGYFTDAGRLVRELQARLDGHRYLLSPKALQWHRGAGSDPTAAALDLKHRLYGLTNAPYHLRSVGNFGEPLVPRETYDFMDAIYSAKNAGDLWRLMRWGDANVVLTRDPSEFFPSERFVRREGGPWMEYWMRECGALFGARAISEGPFRRLPTETRASLEFPEKGGPLAFESRREDRYTVRGDTKGGWGEAIILEPMFAGWRFWVNGRSEEAMGRRSFTSVRVPEGEWILRAMYAPVSWILGCVLTVVSLLTISVYWYVAATRS